MFSLLIYSIKAIFIFFYLTGLRSAIRHWKSLKLDGYSKHRLLVLFLFCKLNICRIKEIGSHGVVLSKLSIKYQWKCALLSTVIIKEDVFSYVGHLWYNLNRVKEFHQLWRISNALIYQSLQSQRLQPTLIRSILTYKGTHMWNSLAELAKESLGN